jgi:hypothetical protein
MTVQELGSIGELIGAVAVFISLVYLAMQIRQNTRAVRISTYQAIMDSSNRIGEFLAQPGVDRIYRLGRKDLSDLNEDDLAQFRLVAGQVMNLYEGLFLHHQQGAIDDDFFGGRFATFHRMVHQPGFKAMWTEGARTYYARSFVEQVDELLATPPGGSSAA